MTRLGSSQEVSKNASVSSFYGCVDELNSAVGFVRALLNEKPESLAPLDLQTVMADLDMLQNRLLTLGGDLATRLSDRWDGMPLLNAAHTRELEVRLDQYNSELPPLEEFILPTGTAVVSALHLARTICRRTEREVIRLQENEDIGPAVIPFLNRLSDFLFVLARWISRKSSYIETAWRR
ncbi:MAG: cob(I)yrinic acid a,c-diamide adenosyltransferase [Candidatus Omnitrophica bacterium]|nr:cob(I)yrinic acid a,c-diamide adenosyltransferase [Candidatus Omnitrophota bacterium]